MRKSVPSKTASSDDELLTVDELCAKAKVHRATFYTWLSDPRLTLSDIVVRLPGGRIRIQWSAFVAWIKDRAHHARSFRGTGS